MVWITVRAKSEVSLLGLSGQWFGIDYSDTLASKKCVFQSSYYMLMIVDTH